MSSKLLATPRYMSNSVTTYRSFYFFKRVSYLIFRPPVKPPKQCKSQPIPQVVNLDKRDTFFSTTVKG